MRPLSSLPGEESYRQTIEVRPVPGHAGACIITVTVTDSVGAYASSQFQFSVNEFAAVPLGLPGLEWSSAAWGDYDNDGKLDLLVAGSTGSNLLTAIYHNNGDGTFSDIQAAFPGVFLGSLAWGDFDNDGLLDVLLTGSTNGPGDAAISRIYRNAGNGTFTDIQAGLPGVYASSAVWGDFDNDGRIDVLIAGETASGWLCQIYRNCGNGTFAPVDAGLPPVYASSIALGDYNRDGRLDILLLGYTPVVVCRVYRNDGDFVFTDIGANLEGYLGSVAWCDYDGDGFLDILVSHTVLETAQIYHNQQDGTFAPAFTLPGSDNGSVAWGDYDNDGRPDLLLSGNTLQGSASVLYRNNGNGAFTNTHAAFEGVYTGTALWGDYDNDGRLDLFLNGYSTGQVSRLYQSATPRTNFPPIAPTQLAVSVGSNSVTFSWDGAQDAETVAAGLTYNLRLGTVAGAQDVVSPEADASGTRRVVGSGNVGGATNITLYDLPISGTYYWSVQAIDAGFAGSPFAPELSFTASFPPMARTLAASGISGNLASFKGLVSAKGTPTAAWYEYGTTPAFGNATAFSTIPGDALYLTLTATVTNLTPETNCYFRLVASNSLGISFGQTLAFYSGIPPLITELLPYSTNQTEATLQALVNPNHSAAAVWFEFGLTAAYGSQSDALTMASNVVSDLAMQPVSGLLPGSLYHSRAVASNDFGITYGDDVVFSTTSQPIAQTFDATDVSLTGAILNAQVNPASKSTFAYFEYGATTNYGNITAFTNVGDGLVTLAVSQPVPDLRPGSTYHFRVVAANSTATVFGKDRSFITRSPFTNSLAKLGPGLLGALVACVDFNNDGRLDVAMTGSTNLNATPRFRLYRNDGPDGFTELNPGIPGVVSGAMAWGDFNNDGRQDLLLCGVTNAFGSIVPLTRLYRNDGNGVFTQIKTSLPGVFDGALAWADINGDGRLDIVLSGLTNNFSTRLFCGIYINLGDETFTNYNANLPGIMYGSIACADFNSDGKVDILLSGVTNTSLSRPFTDVFRNNGNNLFSRLNAGLLPMIDSAAAWGDFDGDGAPDILLAGHTNSSAGFAATRIYRNNGNETFTDIGARLPGVSLGSIAWGDFDGDGRLDALLVGWSGVANSETSTFTSAICQNLGNSSFAVLKPGFPGIRSGNAAWGDFHNEGKLDVLLAGVLSSSGAAISAIYRNQLTISNTPPTAPANLAVVPSGKGAIFRWDAASDTETPGAGLTYNLRIGTSPDGEEIMSVAADTKGTRHLVDRGNIGQRTLWQIADLPASGTFFWSVQAIDNSFAGSPFAPEQMFVLPGAPTVIPAQITGVSTQSVVLNGVVDANGYSGAAYFEWGPSADYGNLSAPFYFDSGAVLQSCTLTLTNLAPQTLYHWRLFATNSAGQASSIDKTFTTSAPEGQRPQFTGSTFVNREAFTLNFQGTSGVTYSVYTSADLKNWPLLGTATADSAGVSQFTDRAVTNDPVRFYRLSAP